LVSRTVLNKSVIVGLVVLALDFLAHKTIANPETLYYFLAKPLISGYIAYYMFEGKFNFFKLKTNTILFYAYFSGLFALIHGLYYRAFELFQGIPLFTRVGDITFAGITLMASSLPESIFGWAILHGGSFFIGIFIAKAIIKK